MLIYPTPTKQDKSLGSPYVDLFREFQHKLLEPHSVLFVIGYSFSDRHVNEIIYRALSTNSTLNVVIFGRKPDEKEHKEKPIFFIDDNRKRLDVDQLWAEAVMLLDGKYNPAWTQQEYRQFVEENKWGK